MTDLSKLNPEDKNESLFLQIHPDLAGPLYDAWDSIGRPEIEGIELCWETIEGEEMIMAVLCMKEDEEGTENDFYDEDEDDEWVQGYEATLRPEPAPLVVVDLRPELTDSYISSEVKRLFAEIDDEAEKS